jgi:thiol-disulfide isomerase/thioredoxin
MKGTIACIAVSVGFVASSKGITATAFVNPTSTVSTRSSSSVLHARPTTRMFFRDDLDRPSFDDVGLEDFATKMKSIVAQRTTAARRQQQVRPSNMKTSETLDEFANLIDEGRRDGKVVVVRFHASWCKTCHAIRPAFDRVAISHPEVIFVDVPVLESNTNIHQGLGVTSIPFGQIYHPRKGLVEEKKLSRNTVSMFEDLIKEHSGWFPHE